MFQKLLLESSGRFIVQGFMRAPFIVVFDIFRDFLLECPDRKIIMPVEFLFFETTVKAFDHSVIRRFSFPGKRLDHIAGFQEILEGKRCELRSLVTMKNQR